MKESEAGYPKELRQEQRNFVINYVGRKVLHSAFGNGEIISQDNEYRIKVQFEGGDIKEFSAPKCFGTFLSLLDPEMVAASAKHLEVQLEKENREKETRKREAWENMMNNAAERKKESGRNKEQKIKSFPTVSAFFDAQKSLIEQEAGYLRATGGRHYRLTDGEHIGFNGDKHIYSFESDIELNLPDNISITLWKNDLSYAATLLSCEDFYLTVSVLTYLGERVPEIELTSESWRLLYDLNDQLDYIRKNPSDIVKSLILEGRRKVDISGTIRKGQETAIELSRTQPILFIWGPPGTGKTEVLAKIANVHIASRQRILMLSHSNVSVDEAALRVLSKDKKQVPGKIVRYGYPRKQEVLNHEFLSSYNLCLVQHPELKEKREALIEERKHLQRNTQRYLQIGKELGEIRERLKYEEKQAVLNSQFVATTVSKAIADSTLYDSSFDVVIFDEASMATIPQIIFSASLATKHFICIGDFAQLPPIVQSDKASDLNADIFQYCGITSAVERNYGHEWLCMLNVQHRMHPEIASFVSKRMYHDLLESAPGMKGKRADIVASEPAKDQCIALADLSGMMSVCTKNKDQSRTNVLSALLSIGIAAKAAQTHETGVITPYNAQSRLIHAMTRDLAESGKVKNKITCATVHQFQGSEKDIIVYDAVDCYRMPYPGMLINSEQNNYANRLFNVAMTRARGKMISLVNAEYMVNKKLSIALMFRQLIDLFSVKSIRGTQILRELDQTAGIRAVADHSLDKAYLEDLKNAESEVRIDIPGYIDISTEMIQRLADILKSLKLERKTVVIRAEHKQDLPPELRQYAIENEFVANPVTIIDGQVTWFGQPASDACFVSENKTLPVLYRPVIRFEGKHCAKALFYVLEMSSTIDMDDHKNEEGTYDTFGAYVRGEMRCEICGKPMALKKGTTRFYISCTDYPKCESRITIEPKMVDDYLYFGNRKGRFCPEDGTSLKAGQGKKNVYVGCQCSSGRHYWRLDEI